MEVENVDLKAETGQKTSTDTSRRYIPLASWAIVVLTCLFIALKITGTGYLPAGDARRHVAQALTHRPFTEVVVMRPEYSMDNSPGWDWLLWELHHKGGWTKDGLMGFSIVALLLCVFLAPLPWLRRPEAWLAALLAQLVAIPELMTRLTQARPYLITETMCMVVLISWSKPEAKNPSRAKIILAAVAIAISTWMHGVWYLWALPVAAFFLAQWWRAAFMLTACWLGGAFAGALMTGHPFVFLRQAVLLITTIYHEHLPQWLMVGELSPHRGEFETLVLLALVFIWRCQQGTAVATLFSSPLLWMIVLCWALGFKADRSWADWGMPAVLVWLALQFQELLNGAWAVSSLKSLLATAFLAVPLFLDATNDLDRRYTRSQTEVPLNASAQELQGWLPDRNGIFYSADLSFFYSTFYQNPDADWRYILGFEPALMPDGDREIYRAIQSGGDIAGAYDLWIKKMRPDDRLAIYTSSMPPLPRLEWQNAGGSLWIGRLPKK